MSTLRSFKAYTNVAPVSPLMLIDATGTVTQALTLPCNLVNLDGYAAATGFFQIFDLAVAPTSTVTVPLKSINVAAAGALPSLLSGLGSITLNKGLFCAMSSTEAVYTAVATNFDVWGEVEEFEQQINGATVAGDLTTGRDSLQVWADAAGPKTLLRVDLKSTIGAAGWLMIFGKDNPIAGDVPDVSVPITDVATLQTLDFGGGNNGFSPFQQTAAYVAKDGCTLALSTTNGTLTATVAATSNIQALYI